MITTAINKYKFSRDKRPVRVFDVAKKELIMLCESVREAERFTGINKRSIYNYIKNKGRSYKNKLNKTICFR